MAFRKKETNTTNKKKSKKTESETESKSKSKSKTESKSETETETESKSKTESETEFESETKSKSEPKSKTKTKTESKSESDSESKSGNGIESKVKSKNKPEKVPKKIVKNDKNNDLPKLEKLLMEQKYDEIKNNIDKYDLTTKDIKNILICDTYKFIKPIFIGDNRLPIAKKFIEEILLQIKKNGYLFNEKDYVVMLKQNYDDKQINIKIIFENFVFDTIDDMITFFKKNKIQFTRNIEKLIDFERYGISKIEENISYLYMSCARDWAAIRYYPNNRIIKLTKKHLEYASANFNYGAYNKITKHILKRMDRTELVCEVKDTQKLACEIKDIPKSDIDNVIIKCTSIDDLDNIIHSNNYIITIKTVLLGIQNKMDIDLVMHMLTYKLEFDEENINQLIMSAKEYAGIEKIIMTIKSYGYKFTKQNYIHMLFSPHYYLIFSENIGGNFIIDEDVVSNIYNKIIIMTVRYNYGFRNLRMFLSCLEKFIMDDNKKSAENILCLYCASVYMLGSGWCVSKIKEIRKKYNVKLTNLALTYLYKKKENITKLIIKIFKEDGVKPDAEQLKQYITITAGNNYINMMMDLFS
jgi:hypothetical protein